MTEQHTSRIPAHNDTYIPDRTWGFLNSDAQTTTPPPIYADLISLAQNMGDLLREKKLRGTFDNAEAIELPSGLSQSQYRQLWTMYGMLSSAYVFSIYEDEAKMLPKSLAVPLYKLSQQLGVPPILNYDAYVYNNFQVISGNGDPIKPESYKPLLTFSSPKDPEHEGEKWFIVIHVAAERAIGPAIAELAKAQNILAAGGSSQDVIDRLNAITAGLGNMAANIARMQERLSVESYHQTTRKYVFPFNGVVFEGVPELNGEPQNLRGETGGQSPVPRALAAFLGLEHKSVDMADLGRHMLPDHQGYVIRLATNPPVKDYLNARPELVEPYNAALKALADFRTGHMRMAGAYLAQHGHVQGTGGSTFQTYLRANRDDTLGAVRPTSNTSGYDAEGALGNGSA